MPFLESATALLTQIESDHRELARLVRKHGRDDPEIETWWSHFSCVWDELTRQLGWPSHARKQDHLLSRVLRTVRGKRSEQPRIAFTSPIFGAGLPLGMPFHPAHSVITTAYGFKICATGRDMWHPLATGHYSTELSETLITVSLAALTECFVDVGANIGFFSLLYASEASPNNIVIACEPSKENANLILAAIRENGWEQKVQLISQAVGERSGIARLNLNALGSGGNTVIEVDDVSFREIMGPSAATFPRAETVPLTTLDDIERAHVAGRRTLVKIDVEGYEKQVLAGAKEWLTRTSAPILLYEAWPNSLLSTKGQNHIEIARILENYGYKIWKVQPPVHSGALVEEFKCDRAARPSETGNYLATPQGASGIEMQLPRIDVRIFGSIPRLHDLSRFTRSCLDTIRSRLNA